MHKIDLRGYRASDEYGGARRRKSMHMARLSTKEQIRRSSHSSTVPATHLKMQITSGLQKYSLEGEAWIVLFPKRKCTVPVPCGRRAKVGEILYGRASGASTNRARTTASEADIEHETNVADLRASEVLQDGYQVEKFVVVGIREPAADWDGVLRVEDVRRRGVVDDDGILQIPPDLRQVLGRNEKQSKPAEASCLP